MTPLVHEALLEQKKPSSRSSAANLAQTIPSSLTLIRCTHANRSGLDAGLEKAIRDAGFDAAKADAIRKLLR